MAQNWTLQYKFSYYKYIPFHNEEPMHQSVSTDLVLVMFPFQAVAESNHHEEGVRGVLPSEARLDTDR